MKKLLFVVSVFVTISLAAQSPRDIEYIRKHAYIAVQEMHIYKVPASITLAQGLLETGGGQSRLADQANNHFGIKCKGESEWPSSKPRIYHDDDAKGECFRKYPSVEESYRDHSKFLAERPYYTALFKLSMTDYKNWAHGLKKSGYATDPQYGPKLISRIERYNLDQFDKVNLEEVYAKLYNLYGNQDDQYLASNTKEASKANNTTVKTTTSTVNPGKKDAYVEETTTTIAKTTSTAPSITVEKRKVNPTARIKKHTNNIPYIVVEAGESIGSIAKSFKKTPTDLARYNELKLGTRITEGQIIFFDKKKSKGSQMAYQVQPGDDMYTISQKFGVKISNLYKYNRMDPGTQPRVGQRMNLKSKIKKS